MSRFPRDKGCRGFREAGILLHPFVGRFVFASMEFSENSPRASNQRIRVARDAKRPRSRRIFPKSTAQSVENVRQEMQALQLRKYPSYDRSLGRADPSCSCRLPPRRGFVAAVYRHGPHNRAAAGAMGGFPVRKHARQQLVCVGERR